MKLNVRIGSAICVSCLAWPLLAQTSEEPGGQDIRLQLSLVSGAAVVGSPFKVEVTVKNDSQTAINLVRLRSGMLRAYQSWGGWSLKVNGPGGQYSFIPHPEIPEPISDRHILELKPGESFGVTLDISTACLQKGKAPYPQMQETPGVYTIILNYDLPETDLAYLTDKALFRWPMTSQELKTEVKRKD